MDDSGPRAPERVPLAEYRQRAFALGGILVCDEDKELMEESHKEFCARWEITYPLRHFNIRKKTGHFGWLASDDTRCNKFMSDLVRFLCGLPILALACVIDRRGYDHRYRPKYEYREMWHMCRTAFCISVERACKYAVSEGRRLRVYPESGDPACNERIEGYYDELRRNGMPFRAETSATYEPLGRDVFAQTLCEFDLKTKRSVGAQIADLCLWPLVQAGYGKDIQYAELERAGRLIECRLPEDRRVRHGTKYSCFEMVRDNS